MWDESPTILVVNLTANTSLTFPEVGLTRSFQIMR